MRDSRDLKSRRIFCGPGTTCFFARALRKSSRCSLRSAAALDSSRSPSTRKTRASSPRYSRSEWGASKHKGKKSSIPPASGSSSIAEVFLAISSSEKPLAKRPAWTIPSMEGSMLTSRQGMIRRRSKVPVEVWFTGSKLRMPRTSSKSSVILAACSWPGTNTSSTSPRTANSPRTLDRWGRADSLQRPADPPVCCGSSVWPRFTSKMRAATSPGSGTGESRARSGATTMRGSLARSEASTSMRAAENRGQGARPFVGHSSPRGKRILPP